MPIGPNANSAKSFMDQKGAETDEEKKKMTSKDFLGLLMSLMYVTNKTRPDCHFHTS